MEIVSVKHAIEPMVQKIKQLCVTKNLFGTAQHTRYEHCIGVCYLAIRHFSALFQADQSLADNTSEEDVNCVMLSF